MKTYKNLYPRIYCFSNLYAAFRAARKGKRNRPAVASLRPELKHWANNAKSVENRLKIAASRPK